MTRWLALLALLLVLGLAACGGDDAALPDGSAEPGPDAEWVIPGVDSGPRQPGLDASHQPGLDASHQPGQDASHQPGQDASHQPGVDGSLPPWPDAGLPPGLDASLPPGRDASLPPGPDASSGPDPHTACNDAANAVCTKIQSCSPFGLQAIYGDLATCKARYSLACLPSFSGQGTHMTPAKVESCAASIPGVSCASFLSLSFGAACAPDPGDLGNGAACGDDGQCQSTFCARAPTSQCGQCAGQTSSGSSCVNGACSGGLVCPSGTCQASVAGKVDDSCSNQTQCDLAHGVGCNTQSGTCIALAVSTDGSCGYDFSGGPFVICPGSGTCDSLMGGNCNSAAADGTSCDPTNGPTCMPPARCSGGTCALPDSSSCH